MARMSSYGPAYGSAPATGRADRLGWPRVLVRMLLVVLPGQLLGMFLGVTALDAGGALRERPGLIVLMLIAGGLLAGAGLALVLRPDRDRLLAYVLVAAAVGAAGYVLLLGLAQLRLPEPSPHTEPLDYLRGAAIMAVAQTAVALPLWWRRARTGS